MDEGQNAVSKDLVEFRTFSSKEEAETAKTELESSGRMWSNVGHVGDKWYIAYSEVGEMCALSVTKAGQYFNLNVELTAGYQVGRSWAECH